tara:strand:- start:485 stop:1420 length:936 start_codon:yes stop_codon:yes gene_type:complete
MSDKTILNPIPNQPHKVSTPAEAEASVQNAEAEIKRRMAAFTSGEVSPESFAEQHKSAIVEGNKKSSYPTMIVDLPSKGLLYAENNPLSVGTVEMKFMTAKEEDILTTESYIKKGVVLDKLFQSLIVSKINYDTMLIGDRDAVMISARIYGYGEIYESKITTPSGETQTVTIDLNDIPHKELDESIYSERDNKFQFTTSAGNKIEFKLLTNGDQKEIQNNLKKVKRGDSRDTQLTSRLFQMIQSIDGNDDPRFIKAFIENDFRAMDSRKFREYVNDIQPGIDMSIDVVDEGTGDSFRTNIAIGLDFFWTNI